MRRAKFILIFLGFISLADLWAFAGQDWVIETRLFRGTKDEGAIKAGAPVVITSFSDPVFISVKAASSASGAEQDSVSALKAELAKIYQLKNVDCISSGQIIWDGKKESLNETILLDGTFFPILFSPKTLNGRTISFKVDMRRYSGQEEREKILNTEMALRLDDPVVLGFPVNGHSYFLSLQVKKQSGSEIRQASIRSAGEDEVFWPLYEFILPQPTFTVMPIYPENCKKENIQGTVVLHVETDKEGKVKTVRVLEKGHSDLAKSAVEAIKQWTYEPVLRKGKPVRAIFYMTVDFKLRYVDSSPEAAEIKRTS